MKPTRSTLRTIFEGSVDEIATPFGIRLQPSGSCALLTARLTASSGKRQKPAGYTERTIARPPTRDDEVWKKLAADDARAYDYTSGKDVPDLSAETGSKLEDMKTFPSLGLPTRESACREIPYERATALALTQPSILIAPG